MNKVTISIKDSITKPFAEDLNALFAKYGGDMVWDWRVEHVSETKSAGKTILVTLDESICDRACSLIENALLDSMAIGPLMFRLSVQEPKKPAKFNSEDFPNHGFVVDSPEHQLLAAAIDYAQSKRGVDQEWGSYRVKWISNDVQTTSTKPFLVVLFKDGFDTAHARAVNEALNLFLADKGWCGIVIDKMDKAQVQAFGVDGSTINTLSIDDVISLLGGVKRLREAAREGDRP